jgi:hypothetical protein
LEVGANLIARTAHRAVQLLGEIRQKRGWPVPLAWDWKNVFQTSAIEVYPAGTLRSLNLDDLVEHQDEKLLQLERVRIKKARAVCKLSSLKLKDVEPIDKKSVHELDAIICVAAAVDFLLGLCSSPTLEQMDVAKKEGWIWVREPDI